MAPFFMLWKRLMFQYFKSFLAHASNENQPLGGEGGKASFLQER